MDQQIQVGWSTALQEVQSKLDSMSSEQLGQLLSKAHYMQKSEDEGERLSGQLLYHQVLAALEVTK
jgi:hypothetical protein